MSTDTIKATVRWSGEHWINYLHRSGDDIDSGSISIYHTSGLKADISNIEGLYNSMMA